MTRRRRRRALGRPIAVTVDEAARMLGCSTWSIRRLLDAGRLPRVPDIGRRVLIPTAALERFAEGAVA